MFEQSFAFSDIPRIFTLSFLEILLSTDNAIVLGILSRSLPAPLRRRALFIGLASAFLLRAAALFAVATLLEYAWVELLGAAYLIYLSIRYFTNKRPPLEQTVTHSFWKTVLLIEVFDLIFALDSIIAGVAFIDGSLPKLWVVYAGGMIGLVAMRYGAALFSRWIDRFPRLETSAYLVVGLIGVKLALIVFGWPIPTPLFWSLIAFFFLLGFFKANRLK
ncbi:MAG TPA: hypothetical protein VLF94_05485 [Chlamydiales bacterium]|nr:hypothetical protein [Chlamydiales bacterium]